MNETSVNAWEEKIIIPTYEAGKAIKHPMFFEKRIYQGSSGAVYPNPVIEKIADQKEDKEYIGLFLENKYLKIMILPELGGRVQMAYDKIRKRHFIYYNQVIKPALVGLCGPWISGGIEFNWPQHHRPSTFERVDYRIEEGEDGSKVIWVNEVERMSHTKGMAGFVLHPDKAYLEIKATIHNRTSLPQTFLWWANPAVKVNDDYQSIFPPDVYAVFDHGKRDVSEFPIAKGTYYKVDYAPGTDISRYKNIPVPTSYMAIQSKFDFIGCYEHDTGAGMLHVANHHISPGKKQWTWGDGAFGHSWDRNLTDEDGPYIELMTGVFTDNQPDFAWLQPNEEKTFEQYFMPYAGVAAVKNATREAMLNLEKENGTWVIKVYATSSYPGARVRVLINGEQVYEITADLSPELVFEKRLDLKTAEKELKLVVEDANGRVLVDYQPEEPAEKSIPPAAIAAEKPEKIRSVEELYLNGLHLEQYRHATFNPMDYYEEGLRREPGDIRCNLAVGQLLLRKGQLLKAEGHFRTAVKSITLRNGNPYSGEAHYNLAYCLVLQDRKEEAFDLFYKACWNDAFQHMGYLELARIAAGRKSFSEALELIEKSLLRNYNSSTARHLKAALLRKTGKAEQCRTIIEDTLKQDPFNHGCRFEQYLLALQLGNEQKATAVATDLTALLHDSAQSYLEYALDYARSGFYDEAVHFLRLYRPGQMNAYPMLYYTMGWLYLQMDDVLSAKEYFEIANQQSPDYCFPDRVEEVIILKAALEYFPDDAKAWYYLGNFWYANQQYPEAISCWENSEALNDRIDTVHRNLSLAYYNKLSDHEKAVTQMEKAFACGHGDSRILMELDQLYRLLNYSLSFRLDHLDQYPALLDDRDDLYLEKVGLLNGSGRYEEARDLILKRQFHPWEGGEGKVTRQYLICHTELAKLCISEGKYEQALQMLDAADDYPDSLGEGKLPNAMMNDVNYLRACIWQILGDAGKALDHFTKATVGEEQPVQAIFYNDVQPDQLLYKGLAWLALGESEKAKALFEKLISFGAKHEHDHIEIDYFAVSLPDLALFSQDLDQMNRIHCQYMMGLGHLGLKQFESAKTYFGQILEINSHHQGALIHQNMSIFLGQMPEVVF